MSEKNFESEKKCVWKFLGPTKRIGPISLARKKSWVWQNFELKKFWIKKKIWGSKIFLGPVELLVQKILGPKKIGSKKFGPNRGSTSWDIADIENVARTYRVSRKKIYPFAANLVNIEYKDLAYLRHNIG